MEANRERGGASRHKACMNVKVLIEAPVRRLRVSSARFFFFFSQQEVKKEHGTCPVSLGFKSYLRLLQELTKMINKKKMKPVL